MSNKLCCLLIFLLSLIIFATKIYADEQADLELIESIKNLDVDGVRKALKAGANPNHKTVDRLPKSAIGHLIVDNPYKLRAEQNIQKALDILKLLFDAGAREQECDCSVISWCAYDNFSSIIDFLLKHRFDPNRTCGDILTPLEVAVQKRNEDAVSVLIRNGVKPLSTDSTAYLRFVGYARDCNVVGMEKNLIKSNFINKADKEGKTALTEAVGCMIVDANWYSSILYLLQKGANPNLQSTYAECQSALHIAMLSTSVHPEDPEAHEVFGLLGIEALIKAGADVSANDENGETPLHKAAVFDNLKGAVLLIEAGANLMKKDNSGKTPLDYARSTMMTKLLKSHGAKEE
jgi:ankyrin repeat protein